MMSKELYSDKDHQILDFIKTNPGVSKEKVVAKIAESGIYSRMTTLKRLGQFQDDGRIKIVKEKPSVQRYRVYINASDPSGAILEELRTSRKHYFALLKGVDKVVSKSKGKAYQARHMPVEQTIGIIKSIMRGYFNESLGTWPTKIPEKEKLRLLYSNVFSQLAEINVEVMQNTDATHRFVGDWNIEQAVPYYNWLKKHQLHQHLEQVISSVKSWNLELELFPHVSFTDLRNGRIVERSLEVILESRSVQNTVKNSP